MSDNTKVTIKNISLLKSHLSCHAMAVASYKLSEKSYYQYRKQLSKLPTETIQQFQDLEPIHVVLKQFVDMESNKKTTQYKFFSGWFWLLLCREKNIKEVRVILHTKDDFAYIEQASWSYLLACELKCMHRNTGLAQLSKAIELVPKDLRKALLGEHYSWSSSKIVQKLSGESNKVLSAQIKNISPQVAIKRSIFDELITEN